MAATTRKCSRSEHRAVTLCNCRRDNVNIIVSFQAACSETMRLKCKKERLRRVVCGRVITVIGNNLSPTSL